MTLSPESRNLEFVGLKHASQLTDFQYMKLVARADNQATVKVVGPNADTDGNSFSLPWEAFCHRIVSTEERLLWPGSYIAHPIAFIQTSQDGVDEWTYGVVSGYTIAVSETTLHVVCSQGVTRLLLLPTSSVIKVDALHYALQTGGGTNAPGLSATELLGQQNLLVAACQRRRTGLPKTVLSNLSLPYNGEELVPLVNPATLQLTRVRRENIVGYNPAAMSKRPANLYSDPVTLPRVTDSEKVAGRRRSVGQDTEIHADHDIDTESALLDSEDDVDDVRHMHRPLAKRARLVTATASYSSSSASSPDSSCSSEDNPIQGPSSHKSERGVVFHPSPTERRAHDTIVHRRHAGKSQHLDFIGFPPVLRGAYYFGFGLGLSIMHFRRAITTGEFATTECGVNMWDFPSKNTLPAPPKATGFSNLIRALSSVHKFAKYLYNKETKRFVGAARDFVIAYADNAPPDPR
ncbi:hypothetical protein PHMEG_0007641 [Phytophthora megakarya]|uniref:Uncharacterized protein n=1 Tax=Phytophthora megakarya TaxID=4795 RepID=A0A225WMB1_9STRA|nr:hypothetical protein PHMEG_0007641 [Phytophthora megakarya]